MSLMQGAYINFSQGKNWWEQSHYWMFDLRITQMTSGTTLFQHGSYVVLPPYLSNLERDMVIKYSASSKQKHHGVEWKRCA